MFLAEADDIPQGAVPTEQGQQHQFQQGREWVPPTTPSPGIGYTFKGTSQVPRFQRKGCLGLLQSPGEDKGLLQGCNTQFVEERFAAAQQIGMRRFRLALTVVNAHGGAVGALVEPVLTEQCPDEIQGLVIATRTFEFQGAVMEGLKIKRLQPGAFDLQPVGEGGGA